MKGRSMGQTHAQKGTAPGRTRRRGATTRTVVGRATGTRRSKKRFLSVTASASVRPATLCGSSVRRLSAPTCGAGAPNAAGNRHWRH